MERDGGNEWMKIGKDPFFKGKCGIVDERCFDFESCSKMRMIMKIDRVFIESLIENILVMAYNIIK